jgi:hypothetical protein
MENVALGGKTHRLGFLGQLWEGFQLQVFKHSTVRQPWHLLQLAKITWQEE